MSVIQLVSELFSIRTYATYRLRLQKNLRSEDLLGRKSP